MKIKDNQKQASFAIIGSLLVLFSALINPIISVVLSVGILTGFAVWKFLKKE